MLIQVNQLGKTFQMGETTFHALRDVEFSVERAEIAKGLYTYMCARCVNLVIQVYERYLPTTDRDIFERLKQLLIIKIEQVAEFPLEYDLLQKAMVIAQREGFEELTGLCGTHRCRGPCGDGQRCADTWDG